MIHNKVLPQTSTRMKTSVKINSTYTNRSVFGNLIHGFSSIFSIYGSSHRGFSVYANSKKADGDAIQSDWLQVGSDMKESIETLKSTHNL